ncbi:MAG: UDP-N-acetylglucosamine 2-epimerase (hydrolyzing) [Rhizobiales bacterium 24-66-13]|jgi:UDP-hydrolysing UDP-N-acetyl-D-glucosamine 2-epimerase|nr:MAG: UDP-N-acetylglucosamine 2-epimerase (hydrolyzing) [Rhizobiales bacterium 35-66-30]OYZ82398.1 MAG: UDP-N-acetylglucosamine 2-epimerase (hydrolyzing) [Rhizobiales bacterium 24-66-13]OZB08859.1 MAG: UDP-N-acetylglucosamine 2-epimerase (hydrolyzing) [Rhizobiales bacterium 39-66-18]HQS46361.1 UDP-N-acetylglucosamine 2-epimerase [Xanthobacteraceae bacterium]
MPRIAIFTSTRADYGLLRTLIGALREIDGVTLVALISGTHLSPSHGRTVAEIDTVAFEAVEMVDILLDTQSDDAMGLEMGIGLFRFTEAFRRLAPDALVLLGDRYEALAAAAAATACKIPIAHIHGGEASFGAMDDVFRHAITKMSHMHFPSTELYRQRVIQMGEHPERVFNVGALGVENARRTVLMEREEVWRRLGLAAGQPYVIGTFHPATLDEGQPLEQLDTLLGALASETDVIAIFTGANSDAGGRMINEALNARAKATPGRLRFFMSLGWLLYLSSVRYARFVIGNSSSGLIEVPSLGVPAIDVGSRQAGRARSEAVLSSSCDSVSLRAAIRFAMTQECQMRATMTPNPYEKAGTAKEIATRLANADYRALLRKGFYDAVKGS